MVYVGRVGVCQCAQGCPFDLFGGYFLCMLACVGSFSVTGTGTCMGMAVGLVSIGWFLLMLNHVSYTYQKL